MYVSSLLTSSFEFFKKHLTVILLGSLVFAALQGAIAVAFIGSNAGNIQKMAKDMQQGGTAMQELMVKVQAGDEEAMAELMKDPEKAKQMEAEFTAVMQKNMKNLGSLSMLFAGLGATVFLSIIVKFLASAFFAVIAVKGSKTLGESLSLGVKWFFPYLGMCVWGFLRSFAWIPVIGIITAIYYFPRYVFSPIYLIDNKKGPMDSIKMSIAHSNGKWGTIVINGLLGGLVIWLCFMVLGFLLAWIPFVPLFLHFVATAFIMIYGVQLAKKVM